MLQKMVWELLENSGGKISFSLFIKVAKGVLQDGCSEHFGKPSEKYPCWIWDFCHVTNFFCFHHRCFLGTVLNFQNRFWKQSYEIWKADFECGIPKVKGFYSNFTSNIKQINFYSP